jgi:nucleoside-diphosphate-sugar epimerase
LLEHYGRLKPEFFFYAGSSEAYASSVTRFGWPVPTEEAVPLGIDDPKEVRWSYGASKLHGEVACFAAQAELGIPVVVGRFHNAYGPNMGIHHVIPDFISRGIGGSFELYGATNTRSFIYIDDAVNAVVALAERARGEVINIGSPVEVAMRELAEIIMREAGWHGEVKEFDAPSGSVARRAPDVGKLRQYVDVDAFVPLSEGIRRTLPSYL